jgi:hypothetical protein
MTDELWRPNQAEWYEFQIHSSSDQLVELPLEILLVIPLLLLLAVLLRWALHPRFDTRQPDSPWNCGESFYHPPVHQYTSGALSFSLRRLFPHNEATLMPDYLPDRLVLSESPDNPQVIAEVFRRGYNLITNKLLQGSEKFGKRVQNKDIRRYLRYVFWVTLITFVVYWLTTPGKGSLP